MATSAYFELFYKKHKVFDKLNYIKKVMASCTNIEQLTDTRLWGLAVMLNLSKFMRKHLSFREAAKVTETMKLVYKEIDAFNLEKENSIRNTDEPFET